MIKSLYYKLLENQAERLNGNSYLILCDSQEIAYWGNVIYPQMLWMVSAPTENLNFARGLYVLVCPQSIVTSKEWKKANIGRVLAVIPDRETLLKKFLVDTKKDIENKEKEIAENVHLETIKFYKYG